MGIDFRAAAGTSVGALNAAFVAQGDYEAAEELFASVTIDRVVDIPEEFLLNGRISRDLKNLRRLSRYVLKQRGLDTTPLKGLIGRYLDEGKIRARGIDFGLVTYDLSSLKPRRLFLEEIPAGRLDDYLLASASHPLFRTATIDETRLTDGGVADNIPFNMMKERGYRKIIAVDLSGLGRTRKPQTENCRVTWIRNSQKLDGVMDFTPECSARSMNLGRLDTLRTFDRLDGVRYFLERDDAGFRALDEALDGGDLRQTVLEALDGLLPGDEAPHQLSNRLLIRRVLPREYARHRFVSLALLECAAACLALPRSRPMSRRELCERIFSAFPTTEADAPPREPERLAPMVKRLQRELEALRSTDIFKLPPARYAAALRTVLGREDRNLALRLLTPLFPELPAAHLVERLFSYRREIFY